MFLAYDGIVFDVLLLNGWDINAIMSDDGADFLYWHHLIDITCVLNPEVNATVFFPPKKFTGINKILKDQKLKSDNNKTFNESSLESVQNDLGTNKVAESATSSTVVPDKPIPPNVLPQPTGKGKSYTDSIGTNSETAKQGTKSYELATKIGPGIFYDPDIAAKTGPMMEPLGGNWVDPMAPIPISPASAESTIVQYANNPFSLQKIKDIGEAIVGGVAGAPLRLIPDKQIIQEVITSPSARARVARQAAEAAAAAAAAVAGAELLPGAAGAATAAIPSAESIDELIRKAAEEFRGFKRPDQPFIEDPEGRPGVVDIPPPPGPKTRFPGNANLPASDIELRDRLQVPRRKLMVWINTGKDGQPEFILDLPYDGCSCDAKLGPTCVNVGTTAVHGNVTGVKRLVFECHESLPLFYGEEKIPRFKGNTERDRLLHIAVFHRRKKRKKVLTPPLISNRWEMKQIPNPETYLNSTVITGKAVFRMDILSNLDVTPDELRQYIMPPVPAGYVRRPPEVSLGSAGNEVLYTVVDDQQMMNNPGGQRWGVHSVVIKDSVFSNNPIDMFGPLFEMEGFRKL